MRTRQCRMPSCGMGMSPVDTCWCGHVGLVHTPWPHLQPSGWLLPASPRRDPGVWTRRTNPIRLTPLSLLPSLLSSGKGIRRGFSAHTTCVYLRRALTGLSCASTESVSSLCRFRRGSDRTRKSHQRQGLKFICLY